MNKIENLLKWCQIQLNEYPNISIKNFTTSWRNGLAFNGLIHKYKPELINYHGLDPNLIYYNNYIAFKNAELHFGIPALLDPNDFVSYECPERLSIITYVSQFYNCLKEMKPDGGYKINKFRNINNGNSAFEIVSSRASVSKLITLICTICQKKVYLLERYVADDKLYHRKCYRTNQINNIDSESEIIGDYLNIYGEINPKLNTNIYVHPLHSKDDIIEIQTSSPINLLEELESQDEESEYLSESLSSYDLSENLSNNNSDENIFITDQESKLVHPQIDDKNEIMIFKENKNEGHDELKSKEEKQDTEINKYFKENEEIQQIIDNKEIYETEKNYLTDSEKNIKVDHYELEINNLKEVNIKNIYDTVVITNAKDVVENKEFKDDVEFNEKKEKGKELNDHLSEINCYKLNKPKIIQAREIKGKVIPVRSCSQENLVVNINEGEVVKPVKQRLYIKKRDKELPYSTFFKVSHNECVRMRSQNLEKDVCTELTTTAKMPTTFQEIPPKFNNENQESSTISEGFLQTKKLIKISDICEGENESDVSSIEDEVHDCVKPQIIRNSIWRKPLISSIIAKKHKSACVPIEGKFRDYAEFKDRLEELNAKQSDIEIKARKIQQRLWEENPNVPFDESLLAKWLDLVEEKDKIFYEENALYSWIKDLKLQEMKLKLEAQIRLLSSTSSNDPINNEKEKELMAKLIETVNKRAELVDAMHEENVRRLEIIKMRHEAQENSTCSQDACSKNLQPKQSKFVKNPKKFWTRKASQF